MWLARPGEICSIYTLGASGLSTGSEGTIISVFLRTGSEGTINPAFLRAVVEGTYFSIIFKRW
jgi:hypothetical protein